MEELQTSAGSRNFGAISQASRHHCMDEPSSWNWKRVEPEEAFTLSEQARARIFLDQLGNRGWIKCTWHHPSSLGARDNLRHENIMLERQLGELLSKPSPELNSAQVEEIRNRLSTVRGSYAGVLAQVRLSNSGPSIFAERFANHSF